MLIKPPTLKEGGHSRPANGSPRLLVSSLRLPFFIPLLIGPASTLVMATLSTGWVGPIITLGGTFWVTRDSIQSSSPTLRNMSAFGLAILFCAFWITVVYCVLAGVAALLPPDSD